MKKRVDSEIERFEKGDYVRVSWFDASEARATLREHQKPECLVAEWGVFLGVKGNPPHLLLGQHFVLLEHVWEATRIPLSLIKSVELVAKHATPQVYLRRYVVRGLNKRNVVKVKNSG